jgi:hypothetical protein
MCVHSHLSLQVAFLQEKKKFASTINMLDEQQGQGNLPYHLDMTEE